VVQDDSARDICEDGATIFVYGEEQVAPRVQREAGDVLSVGKGQRVRLGAGGAI
jgi:hypothetical protein